MQEVFFLVSAFDKFAVNITSCFEVEKEKARRMVDRTTPQQRYRQNLDCLGRHANTPKLGKNL